MNLRLFAVIICITVSAWAQGEPVSFSLPVVSTTTVPLLAVTAADLNNDGKVDIVGTNDTNEVCSALGNGDGSFQPLTCFALSKNATRLVVPAVADFNGDGIPDVAVSLYGYNGEIQILFGLGDGTFEDGIGLDASPLATLTDLKVGDFNQDGIPDLIACAPYNPNSNNPQKASRQGIVFFQGNGQGGFERMYRVGIAAAHLALGDFNKDGMTDVAAPPHTILMANGAFSFTSMFGDFAPADGTGAFALDVSGDNKLDLIVSDKTGVLYVDLGNGDGTFQETMTTTVANERLINGGSANFNSDGYADLVLSTPDNVVIVVGGVGGALTILTVAAPKIASVAAGDFNGDGQPDIVYAFTDPTSGPSVGVLLNTFLQP